MDREGIRLSLCFVNRRYTDLTASSGLLSKPTPAPNAHGSIQGDESAESQALNAHIAPREKRPASSRSTRVRPRSCSFGINRRASQ